MSVLASKFGSLSVLSAALVFSFVANAQQSALPSPQPEFDFDKCMSKATTLHEDAIADCMRQENMRVEQLIYAEYQNILNDENFKPWNGDGTMFRGKLRSLYENWKAYRESYCSLYSFSMDGYLGSELYNTQRCKLDLARKHYDYIKILRLNKNSTPD